jgi:putative endonuclease
MQIASGRMSWGSARERRCDMKQNIEGTRGKEYYVYITTNANNTVLYTGVTNNLARRVYEHKNGLGSAFVKRYNVHKLIYYEMGNDIYSAIAREKQIKGGSRQKKINLINSSNPGWKDLFDEIS